MSQNAVGWKFVVHVYSSISEVHFKHSDCILCAFQIFGNILVTGRNVLLMLKTFGVHSKWRNIERHLKCILTAFWLLSKYSYSIPTAFHTFWSHSRENRNGIGVGGVGSVEERRSLADVLSLSCARPVADGWPLTWVSRPLQVSQLGQLSLSSFRGR